MRSPERQFIVRLNEQRVGVLYTRDDDTRFVFDESYIEDPQRAVLGLRFEENLRARFSAHMRLPPWFSNLLPEGRLRAWIADEGGVSADREMALLAQVGHDLPGAVIVLPADAPSRAANGAYEVLAASPDAERAPAPWRFSLAGVGMKFSMLQRGERFTAPAFGEDGDWIVKLPETRYREVPRNELAMMRLAALVGLDVPETKLVHRDLLTELPPDVWPEGEEHAFAVRRFDRTEGRRRIHLEDFAQVRNLYPGDKYTGSFETIANMIYRRGDERSLLEFVRRLAFNVLIRNGDAHLKNWSLIYRNPRIPELSPAYDLVCTAAYRPTNVPEDLGLRFGGSKRFEDVRRQTFARLAHKLRITGASFEAEVEGVCDRVAAAWPTARALVEDRPWLAERIDATIIQSAEMLRGQRP